MKRLARALLSFLVLALAAAFWISILALVTGCGGSLDPKTPEELEVEEGATPEAVERARELNARRATWQDETFLEHGHVCAFRDIFSSHGYWRARGDRPVFVLVCDTDFDGFECARDWCEAI